MGDRNWGPTLRHESTLWAADGAFVYRETISGREVVGVMESPDIARKAAAALTMADAYWDARSLGWFSTMASGAHWTPPELLRKTADVFHGAAADYDRKATP